MKITPNKPESNMPSIYQVEIKQREDWHFATCDALPGLFVGHKEYQTVLNNVPEAITLLIKNDCGQHVTVQEAVPTEPTLLGNKTYVVTKAA